MQSTSFSSDQYFTWSSGNSGRSRCIFRFSFTSASLGIPRSPLRSSPSPPGRSGRELSEGIHPGTPPSRPTRTLNTGMISRRTLARPERDSSSAPLAATPAPRPETSPAARDSAQPPFPPAAHPAVSPPTLPCFAPHPAPPSPLSFSRSLSPDPGILASALQNWPSFRPVIAPAVTRYRSFTLLLVSYPCQAF